MSAAIRVSHWTELPLSAGGRALVEASAGTGKTWTIGVLYLRLLLEGEAPPGVANIVVTTFTDAASQELRERLRGRVCVIALHQRLPHGPGLGARERDQPVIELPQPCQGAHWHVLDDVPRPGARQQLAQIQVALPVLHQQHDAGRFVVGG